MYRGKVWQTRYWDHIIRNEKDMNNHINYIHYNAVKHGLVESPFKWQYSSIHMYKEEGYYTEEWGVREKIVFKDDFGE
jgi:putative transposase